MREGVTVVSIEIGGNSMKRLNRKALLGVVVCTIFMAFPSQFIWTNAHAQEEEILEAGNYQIELSFSSLESEQQESFFSKEATLIVKNGLYQLALKMIYPDIITDIQIVQLEKTLPSTLDQTENLVQFDINDITRPFTINGTAVLPFEEKEILFQEQLTINVDSLKVNGPIIEEQPPVSSEEETNDEQVEQTKKEWSLDYLLLEDGKNKPSIMNTYVNPTAKIIELAGNYYVQLTILKSHWVTSLTVEQQGELVEPTLVSLVDNVRVIQFEVKDVEKLQRLNVKVDIPELAYHHQYFVDLQFNKEQVADFLGNPLESTKPEQPEKEDITKVPEQVIVKAPIKDLTAMVIKPTTIPLTTLTTKNINNTPEAEQLAFDRTLDEVVEQITEETQQEEVTEAKTISKGITDDTNQQLAQLDKIKILLLIVICLLSGFMLIRRLKNAKLKKSTD